MDDVFEKPVETTARRAAPLEMSPEAFRALGHQLVDQIASFLATLPERPVAPNESPDEVWQALGAGQLPEQGMEPGGCSKKLPAFSLTTPPSTGILASGATSPRRQRPSVPWATF